MPSVLLQRKIITLARRISSDTASLHSPSVAYMREAPTGRITELGSPMANVGNR